MELSRRACAREKSESVRFEEGDRDKDFVLGYLKRLGDRSLDLELQAAFNTLYEEEGSKLLKDKDYWEIFKKYVSNRDCPAAVDFLKNYKRYAKQYGEGATFWKVRNLYANFTCVNTLYETDKYGYYHATNEGGYISWYDFTKEIYRQAGYTTKVIPVSTQEYGLSKAARPFNSRLDKSKLVENGFKPLPTWQDALARYLKEIDY